MARLMYTTYYTLNNFLLFIVVLLKWLFLNKQRNYVKKKYNLVPYGFHSLNADSIHVRCYRKH